MLRSFWIFLKGFITSPGERGPRDLKAEIGEAEISIMRTSFYTIKAKLEEVMEVEIGLNFKSSRSTITIFQFAEPPQTRVMTLATLFYKTMIVFADYSFKSIDCV